MRTLPVKLRMLHKIPALHPGLRPPQSLYWEGADVAPELLSRLPDHGFAIVGTRDPLPQTLHQLRKWISSLAGSGLVLVSGFARGVDACAHAAALDAGLKTIAILGAGIDINYPSEHQSLRARMIREGNLLVSEFPPGTPAHAWQFLHRNRLIAGWSRAVLVAEAKQRSGALNTARWARDAGVASFAIPCWPGNPRFAGNQELIDAHHAIPFWGPHSLGQVWLELAAQPCLPGLAVSRTSDGIGDVALVVDAARTLSLTQGGTTAEALLEWGLSRAWEPSRLFAALRIALELQKLHDLKGRITG